MRAILAHVGYDAELAERIRDLVRPGTTEKKMFGGLAFLVGGHLAVAASGQGGLMVRCNPAETDQHVAEAGAARMEMKGREMDGWLRVAADSLETEEDLGRWLDVGVSYAASLPPEVARLDQSNPVTKRCRMTSATGL